MALNPEKNDLLIEEQLNAGRRICTLIQELGRARTMRFEVNGDYGEKSMASVDNHSLRNMRREIMTNLIQLKCDRKRMDEALALK